MGVGQKVIVQIIYIFCVEMPILHPNTDVEISVG